MRARPVATRNRTAGPAEALSLRFRGEPTHVWTFAVSLVRAQLTLCFSPVDPCFTVTASAIGAQVVRSRPRFLLA